MVSKLSEEKCMFDCNKREKLIVVGEERHQSIITANIKRNDDDLGRKWIEGRESDVKCFTHRSCVSTYTSRTHIERYVKKRAVENETSEGSSERTRRSDAGVFSLQTDCIFCGEEWQKKDPKHPDRWRRYSRVRPVKRVGKATFKD